MGEKVLIRWLKNHFEYYPSDEKLTLEASEYLANLFINSELERLYKKYAIDKEILIQGIYESGTIRYFRNSNLLDGE